MKAVITFALGVICLATSGWAQPKSNSQPAKKSLEDRLVELEKQVEFLSSWLGDVSSRQQSQSVYPDCGKGGYGVLLTEGSQFQLLVSCEDVTPFLEGHKLKLEIGNPYYAEFEGVEITVRYGVDVQDSWANGKSVTIPFTERLKAGTWKRVEVAINPSKAAELRFLAVSIRVKEAVLMSKPN